MTTMERAVARALLETDAVGIDFTNPRVFSSGILSPIYCNVRVPLSHVPQRQVIIDALAEKVAQLEYDAIVGIPSAGDPWAAILAYKVGVFFGYIRKDAKGYGEQKWLEGDIEQGRHILLLEDNVSTGGSSLREVARFREEEYHVTDCISVSTYALQEACDAFRDKGCGLHTTTNIKVIIEEGVKIERIGQEISEKLLEWQADPRKWTADYREG
jgi:orotate phosphoribosyltransferase